MVKRLLTTFFVIALIGLAWASSFNVSLGAQPSGQQKNYEASYTFTVQNGFDRSDQTLHVSLMHSLRDYYAGKSHTLNGVGDYAKFVTPDAVQSIADNLRNATRNTPYEDEEFANAVLTIVHEITYKTSNAKYPVETLVDNQADCDGLSILAASILKAGGLDVVLFLYDSISPSHMNVGVYLDHVPASHSWWVVPSGIEYGNKTYWVAECTSLADWTVGDRPTILAGDKPKVIPLTNCEKNSPVQVSASLNSELQPSAISIDVSTGYSDASATTRTINVSGSISPGFANEVVALFLGQSGYSLNVLRTVTDESGKYVLPLNITFPGTYNVKTSWNGYQNYSGSDSETITVFVDAEQPPLDLLPSSYWENGVSPPQSQPYSQQILTLINQGSKDFLKNNLTGTNVVLSGDFMILSDGREVMPNETTITIPAHQVTYRLPRSRTTVNALVPEQTVTIPGLELFTSQFGFMLQTGDEGNCTASVKLLSDGEVSQLAQNFVGGSALFMNASDVATKNVWRKAVTKVSGDAVSFGVYDENGTLLDSMSKTKRSEGSSDLGILLTYPTGQVLAFKNLKVEALGQSPAPTASGAVQGTGFEWLFPCVRVSLLLAGVGLAVVCLRDRRRTGKRSNSLPETSRDS